MKAERRHELKTNTLAYQLERLPFTLREHGAKILMVVVGALLVFFLVKHRMDSAHAERTVSAETLSSARTLLHELQDAQSWRMPPANIAATVRDSLDTLTGLTDHPQVAAEALAARGDLNWTLANMSGLNASTTQPLLPVDETRADLIQNAAIAYEEVLSKYPKETLSVVTARIGLAAIAEDKGDWDAATEHYQWIQSNESVPQSFRDLAKLRLDGLVVPGQGALPSLAQLRQPIYLATPATQPATLPVESALPMTPPPATAPASTQPVG